MVSGNYSFIDIAVLDPLRQRLADGDALAILDIGLEQVIWANGPGCQLLGHSDVEAVMGASSNLPPVARRQIAAAPGFPRMRSEVGITARLGGARPVALGVSAITLPDGEPAILIAVPAAHGASREAAEIAQQAVSGFSDANSYAALIDADADIAAASEGFLELGIAPETLADLVAEVRHEEDRLVKRLIPARAGRLAAGMARLTDEPARHLLLVIEADEVDEAPAPAEQIDDPVPPAVFAQPDREALDERDEPSANMPDGEREEAGQVTVGAQEPETAQASPVPANDDDAGQAAEKTPAPEGDSRAAGTDEAPAGDRETPAESRAPSAIRFVWRTDAEGRFTTVSEEFAAAVGIEAESLSGHTFREIAARLGMDSDGEVAALLERRDTWSGRTVTWPIAGTGLGIPVDLAALPIYDRARNFEGFRGFGVARMADAAPFAPVATAGTATEPGPAGQEKEAEPEDPFQGEQPAIAQSPGPDRRQSDKIIRLAEHRPQNGQKDEPADDTSGLSASERSAFQQIGERLRRESDAGPADDVTSGAETSGSDRDTAEESPAAATGEAEAPKEPVASEPETAEPVSDQEDQPAVPERVETEAAEPVGEDEAADLPEPDSTEPEPEPVHAALLDELKPAPQLERRDFAPSAFPAASVAAADPSSITALLAGLPFPILVHAGERLHFANREFLRLTGHESLAAMEASGGIDGLFADGADPDRQSGAMRLRRQDGSEIDVNAHLQSIGWNGGKALLLALRPAAEPAARMPARDQDDVESRLYELRAIIDTATDGIVLIDDGGLIRSISRPAEALFGTDSERVEGQPFTSLFAIESQRAAADYLAGLADNGVASVLNDGREVIGREAQGRFIPLFMTMGRLPGDGGYCAVLRDITNWKRVEEDLTQARAHAERASSQKTEFLARVSHEVRTPLNAIIGFSELMLDEKFGPIGNERYRDYLRDINRSGNHVLDLVNDLLDISKIEAGEQEMSYEAVSLNDALAETVAMMQPQANRERVIIRSSFASRLPDVVADQRSVRQIALNLLSNAVRATPAGGQIIVSTAYEQSGDIAVRVRDTGIGMSLSEIEQALKPFKQINALKRARGEGTGLGLPLTKALVEANRARFNISSTPGQGTMVEIVFPSTRVLAD